MKEDGIQDILKFVIAFISICIIGVSIIGKTSRCVGMAANMIGVRKNIIVVAVGPFMFAMINAGITKRKGPFRTEERCRALKHYCYLAKLKPGKPKSGKPKSGKRKLIYGVSKIHFHAGSNASVIM